MALQQLSRDDVNSLGGQLCLTDHNEEYGLENIHYNVCDENSSSLKKRCRGQVWNGKNLVLESFPYTPEIVHDDIESIKKLMEKPFRLFESHEGFSIRMFWFGDKWWITTNRKLDASKNRWVSRVSFGEQFEKAVEKYLPMDSLKEQLKKEYQYVFIVCHDDKNRIVCNPSNRIFHVGTYINGVIDFDERKIP